MKQDINGAEQTVPLNSLVRRCDGCGNITAIDLENTPENKEEMQYPGQTVYEVTQERAMDLWKTACKCACPANTPHHGEGAEQPIA